MSERTLAIFQKPQINLSCSTELRMFMVSLCAIAAIVQSAISDGGASLVIALSAVLTAVLTEFLIGLKTDKQTIFDGSAAASALVLTMLLPNQISPVFAALAAFFSIAVVKFCFGGLGANWFNPALGGWLFVRTACPDVFKNALAASPLSFLTKKLTDGTDTFIPVWDILTQNGFSQQNFNITSFLNRTVFSLFRMELPTAFLDFFAAGNTAIIADRGVYALLLCSIFLIACGASRFVFSAIFLGFYLFLIFMAGALGSGGSLWDGDMLFGLFTGGTLVGAFFLLNDPSTSPKTGRSKAICAFLAALLSYFFRYVMNEPFGVFYAIAIINVIVPTIRSIESTCIFDKIRTERQ